jgi:hypothetical protein
MNNKNPKEIFFVISDFRPWSFFVAFSELKKNKQNNFIVIYSQRWIYANDYGTFFPVWYKKLFISMLRLFFNVVMVEERRLSEKLNVDCLSIKSSMDSIIEQGKYNVNVNELLEVKSGCIDVVKYLKKVENNFTLYIFNGRLASNYSISKEFNSVDTVNVKYYEHQFEHPSYHGYKIYPFPPHNNLKETKALIKLSKSSLLSLTERYRRAIKWKNNKLNNRYTVNYNNLLSENYEVSVFLSTSSEYGALDKKLSGYSFKGNVELVKYALNQYKGKSIIIVFHPNMSSKELINKEYTAIKKIISNNIKICVPDDNCNSYDIIKKSSVVVAEFSTISIDALLLNPNVVLDIQGENSGLNLLLKGEGDLFNLNDKTITIPMLYSMQNELFLTVFSRPLRIILRVMSFISQRVVL